MIIKDNVLDKTTRLVIISVPPEPLRSRLEDFRFALCKASNSYEALRYPVHLTLRTGVNLKENEREKFFGAFSHFIKEKINPFTIRLGSFVTESWPAGNQQGAGSCFAGFEVLQSDDLMDAHRILASFELYRKGPQYLYRPHVTMAFDDLSPEGLRRIRDMIDNKDPYTGLSETEDSFRGAHWICNSIDFYRRDTDHWILDRSIPIFKKA